MIAAGLGLIAMAVGGTVAGGLTREVRDIKWLLRGVLALVAVVVIGGLSFGLSIGSLIPVTAFAAIPLLVATLISRWVRAESSRAWVTLIVEFECLLFLGISGATVGSEGEWLGSLLLSLPYPGLAGTTAGTVVLLAGIVMWLGPVANGIVRMVLTAAGADIAASEQRLRGGRVIGILERWLIFGFVVAGHPTAAAFIVSAKSILRFPELSERARHGADGENDLDTVTEYLLLGSLVSWTIAVLPAVLFR